MTIRSERLVRLIELATIEAFDIGERVRFKAPVEEYTIGGTSFADMGNPVVRAYPSCYVGGWSRDTYLPKVHKSWPDFVKKWRSYGLDVIKLELIEPE